MTEILKIGRLLKTDKDGCIVSESSADRIASPWREAVEEIKNAYLTHLGDVVHSVYVRGTVSRGDPTGNRRSSHQYFYSLRSKNTVWLLP